MRPLPDARVSTPVTWDELTTCDPRDFTLATVPKRFAAIGDPHAAIDEVAHSPVKNVIRVYPDRIAFCVNNECALYCRYCLRKRMVGDEDWTMQKRELEVARGDAAAVVRHEEAVVQRLVHAHLDGVRAGVERVLEHLLEGRKRTFDDLARGDARSGLGRKAQDGTSQRASGAVAMLG